MAGTCIRFADRANEQLMEFVADTVAEVQDLPTTTTFGKGAFATYQMTAPLGSTCVVGNEGGDILVYALFGFGWREV